MLLAFVAPLGLIIGSFLNVVAYRLPRGESIVKPRSRCTSCGTEVRALDNVPLISWIVLRGRCRNCSAQISARYPVIELVTGIVFAVVALARGPHLELLVDLPFAAMLIAVADIDIEHQIVPNRILAPVAIWAVAASAVVQTDRLPELLIAGASAFTFLLVAALAYPGGMGMGDVKLAGVMGLCLGLPVAPAMLIAFLTGSIVGVGIMLRHGAGARKRKVPFGPFLALGGLVALVAGPELIDLYGRAFLGS
ncbi:MAG: leader peptidase (prepilin peptidase) / N-methyltransferase [Thermoleophilaceae bacterium]|jgi:leader peptidase (prepilin peptidase)/N-methyltransferase|nr:leader peptidase (prepilin peptidase) / N-methyltransferase [Thermoleophilaceae bacterium]